MKRYVLLEPDTIEVIPAEGDLDATVSVFCERTLMLFPCAEISAVRLQKNVTVDRLQRFDALELTAKDAFFEEQQLLLIPLTRPDFASFYAALSLARPDLCREIPEEIYRPEPCDQTGHHLRKNRAALDEAPDHCKD